MLERGDLRLHGGDGALVAQVGLRVAVQLVLQLVLHSRQREKHS